MRYEVTVAIIAVIPALITAVVSIAHNNLDLNVKLENIQQRLERIEKKQDETNHVKERVAMLERDDKTTFMRIDELRDEIHALHELHK